MDEKTMNETADTAPLDDPEPQPPTAPEPGDCCHSGCTFCVEDMYQEELDRYRAAHQAWLQRRQ